MPPSFPILSKDSPAASIRSQEGAEGPMGRNGGARETWRLTINTASATCTGAALVQESLWKYLHKTNLAPLKTTAPTNPDTIVALSNLGTPVAPSFLHQHHHQHQIPGYFRNPDNNFPSPSIVSTSTVTEKEPRYLDPMAANHPWQLMHANVGMRTSSCGETNAPVLQPYNDHLRLNYTDFGSIGVETEPNDQYSLYLNNNFTSSEGPDSNRRQPSRGFIDAWSIASRENPMTPGTTTASELSNNGSIKSPVLRDKNLPFSSLTLSMPSCDGTTLEDLGGYGSNRDGSRCK